MAHTGPSRSTETAVPPPATWPLTKPRKGLLVYESETRSAATITAVDDTGFDVRVHNGAYDARVEGGEFLIHTHSRRGSGTIRQAGRVEEITALTREQVLKLYLDGVPGVAALMKGHGQDQGVGCLEQLIQERGDDDELAGRAITFLKEKGLAGDFADWLAEQPAPTRDEDDELGFRFD